MKSVWSKEGRGETGGEGEAGEGERCGLGNGGVGLGREGGMGDAGERMR